MFREDEKITVYVNGEEEQMNVADVVFKIHDHKRKSLERQKKPHVNFSNNYFDVNLKVKSLNVLNGKFCKDTIKKLIVSNLQPSVMVTYVAEGKTVNVLLPSDQLILNSSYEAVLPSVDLKLANGITITKVAKKGNFKFVNVETTATKNIEKLGILMLSNFNK